MRFWIGVSAAFGAGTLIGVAIGILSVEDKLKKEYVEANASMRRAFEAARIDAETPVVSEDELDEPLFLVNRDPEGTAFESPATIYSKQKMDRDDILHLAGKIVVEEKDLLESPPTNPYHQAVTPVNGVYASFAELDEDEYYEEDGRTKDQLTMIFDDGVARFFNQGEEIDDAFERVGGTIVDDIRKSVGEGQPIVYVRNNQTDVDYEVVFEQP